MAVDDHCAGELEKINDQVFLGLEENFVTRYIPIETCTRCAQLGHNYLDCKRKVRCTKCAALHEHTDCKNEDLKCANCVERKLDVKLVNHSVFSLACPTLRDLMEYVALWYQNEEKRMDHLLLLN